MAKNLKVIKLQVGSLATNCYILINNKSHDSIIIDPGDDGDFIERIISDNGCKLKAIVATHGHFDHILAVTELKLAYQVPFYINKKDEFLVKNSERSAKHFLHIQVDPPSPIDFDLEKKSVIAIGNSKLLVIKTPGHTPGSVCFYNNENNILFSGDLVFKKGVGRTDFSYSSVTDLRKSLEVIFKLPSKTIVYPGHGEATTVESITYCNEESLLIN